MPQQNEDSFRHSEYRRLIPWSTRLTREGPWLREFLSSCPGKRIADLGCGSGEHAAFAAELGFVAVGVDRSEAQVESAAELVESTRGELSFLQADLTELDRHVDEPFDGALCLGNVLPFLDDEALEKALASWSRCLRDDGGLLMQWLNYAALRRSGTRNLPIVIQPGDAEGEELVLIRLFRFDGEKHLSFFPTTLDLPAGHEDGATLRRARAIRLRSWNHEEITSLLRRSGFEVESLQGGVEGEAFDPEHSKDIVLRARRRI